MSFQHSGFQHNAFQVELPSTSATPFVQQETTKAPLRTWVAAAIAVTWFNSVIMPEGPKPSADQNLEVPGKQVRQVDRTQHPNLLLTTLSTPAQVVLPFSQQDWRTPLKQVRSRVELDKNYLLGIQPPPVRPLEWGVPKQAVRVNVTFDQVPLGIKLPPSAAADTKTFQVIDWRLPTKPWDSITPASWFNSAIMPKPDDPPVQGSGIPFLAQDWEPRKLLYTHRAPDYIVPLTLTLPIYEVAREALVLQGKRLVLKQSPENTQSRVILEGPVVAPFLSKDWSVKRLPLRRDVTPDQTAIVLQLVEVPETRLALLIHQERLPLRQVVTLHQSRLLLEVPPVAPFFGSPQERAKGNPRLDLSWSQNLLENTLGLGIIPPFSQSDWRYPNLSKAAKTLVNQDQGSLVVGPIPPVVVPANTGRSRYWRARQGIDWNIPFSFAEVIQPEIKSVELQVKEQKDYKKSLLVIKNNQIDTKAIEKEIARVEEKIRELLVKKQNYYQEYHDYIQAYKKDKQHNRELKRAYLASFKADVVEEEELMELIELGVL